MRQQLRLDACALIGHGNARERPGALQPDPDTRARRTELDGIGEEVPDDLLQPIGFGKERTSSRIEGGVQLDILRVRHALDRLDGRLDDGQRIDLSAFNPQLARDDARDVEEILDQLRKEFRVPLDHLKPSCGADRILESDPQHAGPSEHRRERRAQLVRDHRQEMVLRLVRLPQLAPRLLQVAHDPFVGAHVAQDPDGADDRAVGIPEGGSVQGSRNDLAGRAARIQPDVAGHTALHDLAERRDEFLGFRRAEKARDGLFEDFVTAKAEQLRDRRVRFQDLAAEIADEDRVRSVCDDDIRRESAAHVIVEGRISAQATKTHGRKLIHSLFPLLALPLPTKARQRSDGCPGSVAQALRRRWGPARPRKKVRDWPAHSGYLPAPTMDGRFILVEGARQNNLKTVCVRVPVGAVTAVTGVAGAGKSSLAFDVLHAEGYRRYVETFSPYARQFLERLDRPAADRIEGVLASPAIDRTAPVRTSRSTVGTMTSIADYFRALWARAAVLHCKSCGQVVVRDSPSSIFNALIAAAEGNQVLLCFPCRVGRVSAKALRETLQETGFRRVLENGSPVVLEEAELRAHDGVVTVVLDRI